MKGKRGMKVQDLNVKGIITLLKIQVRFQLLNVPYFSAAQLPKRTLNILQKCC